MGHLIKQVYFVNLMDAIINEPQTVDVTIYNFYRIVAISL